MMPLSATNDLRGGLLTNEQMASISTPYAALMPGLVDLLGPLVGCLVGRLAGTWWTIVGQFEPYLDLVVVALAIDHLTGCGLLDSAGSVTLNNVV